MARDRSRGYWLIKSEPYKYPWSELVSEGWTHWDGVRNYEARNNLRAMKVGDLCLFYHSNEGKEVVGIARVSREFYPDPTTDDERWSVVDVRPVVAFAEPVTLAAIKAEPALAEMALVRRSRLSVVAVEPSEFKRILAMGKTELPGSVNSGPPGKKQMAKKRPTKKQAIKKSAGSRA